MADERSDGFGLERQSFKVGLPAWLFQLEWVGEWGRTRGERVGEVLDHTADLIGVTTDELGDLIGATEERRDVMGRVLGRASEVADPDYREALARLLAAACDDTKIDEAAYLTALVHRLEPAELRVFLWHFHFLRDEGDRRIYVGPKEAEQVQTRATMDLSGRPPPGVPEAVKKAAIRTLVGAGLLVEETREIGRRGSADWDTLPPRVTTTINPSRVGLTLLVHLFPELESRVRF